MENLSKIYSLTERIRKGELLAEEFEIMKRVSVVEKLVVNGLIYLLNKSLDLAAACFEAALKQKPDLALPKFYLGVIYRYRSQNSIGQIVDVYRDVMLGRLENNKGDVYSKYILDYVRNPGGKEGYGWDLNDYRDAFWQGYIGLPFKKFSDNISTNIILDHLSEILNDELVLMDIGIGEGHQMALLLEKIADYLTARSISTVKKIMVVGIDMDEESLDRARTILDQLSCTRLKPLGIEVSLVLSCITIENFIKYFDWAIKLIKERNSFDVVVTSMTLHHLFGADGKEKLLRFVKDVVQPKLFVVNEIYSGQEVNIGTLDPRHAYDTRTYFENEIELIERYDLGVHNGQDLNKMVNEFLLTEVRSLLNEPRNQQKEFFIAPRDWEGLFRKVGLEIISPKPSWFSQKDIEKEPFSCELKDNYLVTVKYNDLELFYTFVLKS